MFCLEIFDVVLTVLHISLILFFIFGWIYRKTRKVHYLLVTVIAISWFVLGLYNGFGYCFLTDFHWRIKKELGEGQLPVSFIKYILDKVTGKSFNDIFVDYLTLTFFIFVFIASTYLYLQDEIRKSKK